MSYAALRVLPDFGSWTSFVVESTAVRSGLTPRTFATFENSHAGSSRYSGSGRTFALISASWRSVTASASASSAFKFASVSTT